MPTFQRQNSRAVVQLWKQEAMMIAKAGGRRVFHGAPGGVGCHSSRGRTAGSALNRWLVP